MILYIWAGIKILDIRGEDIIFRGFMIKDILRRAGMVFHIPKKMETIFTLMPVILFHSGRMNGVSGSIPVPPLDSTLVITTACLHILISVIALLLIVCTIIITLSVKLKRQTRSLLSEVNRMKH